MNTIMGTVSRAGKRAAFSSALIMRSSRDSADMMRSDWASGVPYFSACIRVLTTPRTTGRSTRMARFLSALRRSGRKPSSRPVRPSSSASSGQARSISWLTRLRVASRLRPASAQMTMRSSTSGRDFRILSLRFWVVFLTTMSGR